MTELLLPDVSEYQREVVWTEVAAANGGAAIIRAMEGTDHVDAAWDGGARRDAARGAGIRVCGIYQYLRADQPAVPQAEAFVKLVGRLTPGERPRARRSRAAGTPGAWRRRRAVARTRGGGQARVHGQVAVHAPRQVELRRHRH